ncbi:MAG TPA: M14 family zinc carboxypeptidase [Flavitalea sp.]|nr:M14 family zinc carboxypeptidase [Flavitalea sp.]
MTLGLAVSGCGLNDDSEIIIAIDTEFPGGNIKIDSIRGAEVYLRPDLRGNGTDWFYWYFAATSATNDSVKFIFNAPGCLGIRGPAVSLDGGLTWNWLTESEMRANEFSYLLEAGREIRFSMGMPYVEADFRRFIKPYATHPSVRLDTLCITPKGRVTERLTISPGTGRPGKHRILLTARHHACEMMTNYLLEGLVSAVLSDDPQMIALRNNSEFWIIPFMDKDGVEQGDQGKNRLPHDHNRDYSGESIYCSTAALRQQTPIWASRGLDFALDLHCPRLTGGKYEETIYMLGLEDPDIQRQQYAFLRQLIAAGTGPLRLDTDTSFLPFGVSWNTSENYSEGRNFSSWAASLPGTRMASTLEAPYATHKNITVTPQNLRLLGKDIASGLYRFLNIGEHTAR